MWSMLKQAHMDRMFMDEATSDLPPGSYNPLIQRPKFTLIIPSNQAWEKVQTHFHKAYAALQEGQFPQFVSGKRLLYL